MLTKYQADSKPVEINIVSLKSNILERFAPIEHKHTLDVYLDFHLLIKMYKSYSCLHSKYPNSLNSMDRQSESENFIKGV